MGVTIHYRGTLNDLEQLGDLQRELADIAESVGWKWRTLDDDWAVPPSASLVHADGRATINGHLGLKGIDLIPEGKSEPVSFLFDATGHLRSIMGMILLGGTRVPTICRPGRPFSRGYRLAHRGLPAKNTDWGKEKR